MRPRSKRSRMTLRKVAKLVGGELEGDPQLEIKGADVLEEAREQDITYIVSKRYLKASERSFASAVIVPPGLEVKKPRLVVENPYEAFAKVIEFFYGPTSADIGDGADFNEDRDICSFPLGRFGEPFRDLTGSALVYTPEQVEHTVTYVKAILEQLPEGGCLIIDFRGILSLDFKLAWEVAKRLRRDTSRKGARLFKGKHYLLRNMNESCESTINAVLRLLQEAALVEAHDGGGGELQVIGHFPSYLQEALEQIPKDRFLSTQEIAKRLRSYNSRNGPAEIMRRLYDWGFVIRRFELKDRARLAVVYKYRRISSEDFRGFEQR